MSWLHRPAATSKYIINAAATQIATLSSSHCRTQQAHLQALSHSKQTTTTPNLQKASAKQYKTHRSHPHAQSLLKSPSSTFDSISDGIMNSTSPTIDSKPLTSSNNLLQPAAESASKPKTKSKKGIKRKAGRVVAITNHLTKPNLSPDQPSSLSDSEVPSKPRAPPSKASGGIPSPSTPYLLQSLPPPTTLPFPRQILVVLDLNGTLLFRPSRRHPSRFIERPHARHFLNYCLDTFHLAIWSSARPQNVNNMVAQLLTPEQRQKCVVIWARDKFGLAKADYDARVQVYKRLSIIWNQPQVRSSHPHFANGGCWDQSNTVLVDDSREKGRSEPYNILPIPEFSGLEREPAHVLPQVHDYINTLCFQADISRYMRENPFGLNPSYVLPAAS